MAEEGPTVFCGVPTLFAAVVAEQEKAGEAPVHSIRICTSAGEALPREIGERWEALWGAEILDGVGSTEMLHIFLSNSAGDIGRIRHFRPSRCPDTICRLVDTDGMTRMWPRTRSVSFWCSGAVCLGRATGTSREKSRCRLSRGVWTRTGDKYDRAANDGRYRLLRPHG